MEGVDHIHIVEVRGGCLVGQVHRMVQGQIPHREGLEFGIARGSAPLVLMVQLAQAGGKLSAAGARGSDHHQLPGGLDILVSSEALVTDHQGRIGGVALDGVVVVDLQSHPLQTLLEGGGDGLAPEPGQHHAGHIQAKVPEYIDEPDHIPVIGDAQIPPDLVLFNIVGVDGNDHLHLILQLQQHPQLAVRLKARQHPGSMVVVI